MSANQTTEAMQQLHATHRIGEKQLIEQLMAESQLPEGMGCRIRQRAENLISTCRQSTDSSRGVAALMHEYGLTNDEGLVLMGLAECLLRIPDAMTCDLLIESTLNSGDWAAHLNRHSSLLVNSSAFGLLVGERAIRYWSGSNSGSASGDAIQGLCRSLGEPLLRTAIKLAMQLVGDQFVIGADIHLAMARAESFERIGYRYSYDILGEAALTAADAQRYLKQYQCSIAEIGKTQRGGPELGAGISVKLSALHPRFEVSQRQRVIDELVPIVLSLALEARQQDIGLTIDAEEASRLIIALEVFQAVYESYELRGWQGLGIAVQAYQKRAPAVIQWLVGLAASVGRRIPVRLVKGAYWDSEIKWSQLGGYADYPVFTRKSATDLCYQVCVKRLLDNRSLIYPQFATHNGYTIATVLELDDGQVFPRREGYEFQRLHGMAETLYDPVITDQGLSCRIYAPVGDQSDLLAYLVRRLLENGANNSFLHRLMDSAEPVASMLDNPFELLKQAGADGNARIPLPSGLYGYSETDNRATGKPPLESGQRRNSDGVDLDCQNTLDDLVNGIADWWQQQQTSVANTVDQGGLQGPWNEVVNPANRQQLVGRVCYSSAEEISQVLSRAERAFPDWSMRPVAQRSQCLRRLADSLETNRFQLVGLLNKEAGKSLADGVAEVREAVDFCRYYADQAELPGFCEPPAFGCATARGVVVAISPWNFPLAIFLGQVSAAIVCGNTVIAKPAEQTSLIAQLVCQLMVQSGIPDAVVQLLLGPGEAIGKQLLADSRVTAVMFTGSTATGRSINQALAHREGG
ncbi:MAG: bifunctional proline dehydrogenase/L-glutamate gamma-semialdehyde dehydrogenase PutA, partial [Immundisolibacteraceae bacterium]|nr:bifunctional proline dehydrogenase/L-glutamate gamma-semialdehyde dehydrogenase PutA [Immundisolibacteraceae bacterium]